MFEQDHSHNHGDEFPQCKVTLVKRLATKTPCLHSYKSEQLGLKRDELNQQALLRG